MQELAQDYVNQLNSFNQEHFLTFRKTFIKKFNKANLVSKVVTTNKISLADNKTQKAVSYGVSVATDILGMATPGSGTICKLVDDFIGSVFQGHRKKGYKKLDSISAHTTKTEILAQAIANGLQLYYKQDLCPQKITKAQVRGSMAAERVIKQVKESESTSSETTLKDWLSRILSSMISYDYTKTDMKDAKKVKELIIVFTPEELDALLLISSSQLLGLPADFLLKMLKNEEELATYKAENSEQVAKLNAKFSRIFEQIESENSRSEERLKEMDKTIKQYAEELQRTGNQIDIRYTVIARGAKVYGKVDSKVIGRLAVSVEAPEDPSERTLAAIERLMDKANQIEKDRGPIAIKIDGTVISEDAEVVKEAEVIAKTVAYQAAAIKFTERKSPGLFDTLPTKQQIGAPKDTHPEEPQQSNTPNPQ